MKSNILRPGLVLAASLCAGSFAHAAAQASHWAYTGKHADPSHWAALSPEFESCAKGHAQSPVDIRATVKADLPALRFDYTQADPVILNNGHTVQVNLPPGQRLTIGDRSFELLQFHFHTPSEEEIHGKRAPMEVHFVHKDVEGKLAVVSVLLQAGKASKAYAPVFDHLPRPGEKITVDGLHLDLARLLPAATGYYRFQGSLTTPPCSEGVQWIVLKQPLALGAGQIRAFHTLFKANARPVQPLNGRVVEESN
ncbi:carbonic anhydrase [Variovorax sp. OV329]|uniref:carbonic anhydrase n=1 Tax=Variovorax sp. OV329 TaxID=1882825 RepID=UPI0008E942EC|nr:carbonic anhydrase family protein [Variovorax sp. OV329]SFM72159.1 carbonic anhydrase [Variovorax sp. OV329]